MSPPGPVDRCDDFRAVCWILTSKSLSLRFFASQFEIESLKPVGKQAADVQLRLYLDILLILCVDINCQRKVWSVNTIRLAV